MAAEWQSGIRRPNPYEQAAPAKGKAGGGSKVAEKGKGAAPTGGGGQKQENSEVQRNFMKEDTSTLGIALRAVPDATTEEAAHQKTAFKLNACAGEWTPNQ